MITRINSISFVRCIKTKTNENYPLGVKGKTNKFGNYVWEEGVFMELDNGMKIDTIGRTGKVFDGKLQEVEVWDAHELDPKFYISNLKIGK